MKRSLSKRDFDAALKRLSIQERTAEMARRVLVQGETRASVADAFQVTGGAVSQAVSRVWQAHVLNHEIPPGYERLDNVILPADKAGIVRTWQRDAERQTAAQGAQNTRLKP